MLQTEPEPEMRGRVPGVGRSAGTGRQLAGPPLLGLLVEFAGARGALVAGGLLIAGVIFAGGLRGRILARGTARSPAQPATPQMVLPALSQAA